MNESIELKGRYSDFIGEYSCAYSTEYCNEIIRCFDYYQDIDAVYCGDDQFVNSNAGRFDWALDLYNMSPSMNGNVSQQMNEVLFECLEEYTQVFGHLKTVPFYSLAQKIQKTPAGGGYHVWHDENSSIQEARRSLVWMVYLNDDYEGGETEYLYYKKRIQPERGKLLIWPAGMTHCHRGGLVLKGDKYVATGWFYLGGMNYGREE
jgi:hypothetical protein